MLKQLVNEARFSLLIENTGPLLVKSGRPTLSDADMVPVEVHRNDRWEEYVPGSSIKGVFRNHLEKVTRTVASQPSIVCNPFNRSQEPDIFCGQRFQHRKSRGGGAAPTNDVVYRDSCPMCRLFGSTSFIGRISIADAYLAPGSGATTERRDGVGIDRLTGGAAGTAKFDLRVVSPGARFVTPVLLRNFEIWQLGAVLQVVQDGQDGLLQLGSGRSRGLGAITVQLAAPDGATGDTAGLDIHYIGAAPPTTAPAIWGLGHFLAEDRRYGTQPDDLLTLPTAPTESRRGVRIVQTVRGAGLAKLVDGATLAFADRMRDWPAPAADAEAPGQRARA